MASDLNASTFAWNNEFRLIANISACIPRLQTATRHESTFLPILRNRDWTRLLVMN
jgi:hypothetical protein